MPSPLGKKKVKQHSKMMGLLNKETRMSQVDVVHVDLALLHELPPPVRWQLVWKDPSLEANLAYILVIIPTWAPQKTNENVIRPITNYGAILFNP